MATPRAATSDVRRCSPPLEPRKPRAAFAEIVDNNYLRRRLGSVYTAARRLGTPTFSAERMRQIIAEHAVIIDAMIAGDAEAASAAALDHAEKARAITLARLLA